jgi:shikimate kinase
LRVSLVGVSCVGTTTIGRILAERRSWPSFDLDDEIERHFGISIEQLQARFLTSYDYRKECAMVLERIATANPDCVIALPPSGLRDAFLRVVRRVPCVTVAFHDTPENILERITFYDIDSQRIQKHLTEAHGLQLASGDSHGHQGFADGWPRRVRRAVPRTGRLGRASRF